MRLWKDDEMNNLGKMNVDMKLLTITFWSSLYTDSRNHVMQLKPSFYVVALWFNHFILYCNDDLDPDLEFIGVSPWPHQQPPTSHVSSKRQNFNLDWYHKILQEEGNFEVVIT